MTTGLAGTIGLAGNTGLAGTTELAGPFGALRAAGPAPVAGLRSVPWRPVDLAVLLAGSALSLIGAAAAWLGASGRPDVQGGITWLAVGIAALLPGLGACAMFLLAGLRAVRLAQRRLVLAPVLPAAPQALTNSALTNSALTNSAPADSVADHPLVTLAGSALYHRRDCLLVAGKPVGPMAPGTNACRVCRP